VIYGSSLQRHDLYPNLICMDWASRALDKFAFMSACIVLLFVRIDVLSNFLD